MNKYYIGRVKLNIYSENKHATKFRNLNLELI
jgi:hypothetical protein